MDALEASLHLSDGSYRSESISSNLSGLSGYENELLELPSLTAYSPVNLTNQTITKNNVEDTFHSNKIKNLTEELKKSVKLNEELKSKLLLNQCKYELEYHSKIEKLIFANSKLHSLLNLANEHIKQLENKTHKNDITSYKHFQDRHAALEKLNYELNLKIDFLQNEVEFWKNNLEEYEKNNKQLKTDLEETKYNLDVKNSAISALKHKVSELHLKNQNILQSTVHISNDLSIKKNEIDALRNSELWYKEQLNICQNEKKKVLEENTRLASELASKVHYTCDLNLEICNYKNRIKELIIKQNKERDELNRKLQAFKENVDKRTDSSDCLLLDVLQENCSYSLKHNEDLTCEIDFMKREIALWQSYFELIKNENSKLTSLNAVCQEKLNEKESYIKSLHLQINNFSANLNSLKMQLEIKQNQVAELTQENIEMQTTLSALTRDKEEAEALVISIKENFSKALDRFKDMKQKLQEKEHLLSKTQEENKRLLMNSNRQLAELEKLQAEIRKIKNLEKNISELKSEEESLVNKKINEQKTAQKVENLKLLQEEDKPQHECRQEQVLHFGNLEIKSLEKNDLDESIEKHKCEEESLQEKVGCLSQIVIDLQNALENVNDKNNNQNCGIVSLREKNERDQWHYSSQIKFNFQTEALVLTVLNLEAFQYSWGKQHPINENKKCGVFINGIQSLFLSNANREKHAQLEKQVQIVLEDNRKTEEGIERTNSIENLKKRRMAPKDFRNVENLIILLKVKEMELVEKEKKYRSIYRTLLRKVKENMHGRKKAEKRCTYLEELYISAFEELNILKLKHATEEMPIKCDIETCELLKKNFEQKEDLQPNVILKRESRETWGKSIASNDKVEFLKNKLKDSKNKFNLHSNLMLQIQELSQPKEKIERNSENLELNSNDKYPELAVKDNVTVTMMEHSVATLKNTSNEFHEKIPVKQNLHLECQKRIEKLIHDLEHQKDENKILSEKIVLSSCKLNQLEEELSTLQVQKQLLDADWDKRESELQNINSLLQHQVFTLKNKLNIVINEQTFLRRLCTDLKTALDATMQENKVMKKRCSKLLNHQVKASLPDLTLNLHIQNWNEGYIYQLLHRNDKSSQIPLPQLRNSLLTLKDQVFGLQKQIFEKKCFKNS